MSDSAEKYLAIRILKTGNFCPSQWEVLAFPRPLYIRYRSGILTVQIDEGDSLSEDLLRKLVGDPLDGTMTTEAMLSHTQTLIDWTQLYREEPT